MKDVDEPACEVCGQPTRSWRLGAGNVLDRCVSCGHVRRDLERCPAAHRLDAWGGEVEMDRVRLSLTYRRLRALLANPPRAVFEAGYGSGGLLRRFADDGAEVAGADPGALGIDVDPLVAASGGLVAGPVESVVAGNRGYDLVYAVHVVEHVPDIWAFVHACRRLLAPGGTFVLVTPAGDSDGPALFGSSWWMLEDPTHVRFFTELSLSLLLARSGLVDVAVRRPVADSLGVEAASLVRRLDRATAERGVLPRLTTRVAVAASLPLVLPLRTLRPRSRPTLDGVGRAPAAPM